MEQGRITEYGKLNDVQKEEAVEIFIEGFGHLMTFTKDKEILKSLFLTTFHPSYVLAYVEAEQVLGILGIATNQIRPIKFEMDICIKLLGKYKGTLICKQMNAIFQSQAVKEDTDLYIDVLATSKAARGKGVATKLLNYSFNLQNYENYYIEVLSKNVNAKRLYEKIGFAVYKKSYFSALSLMGFGYPIKMKK